MSLAEKLQRALDSRQLRQILRRLPAPSSICNAVSIDESHATPSGSSSLIDFCSNDYLSLASNATLRSRFLKKINEAPDILGSGGSRLLVNGSAHHALEERLRAFFDVPAALLFNSGFDANVSFFSCVPQAGDVVIYDEFIHASVHDGVRTWSSRRGGVHFAFKHNSISSLRELLLQLSSENPGLGLEDNSIFIAVETLYSMDGTFAPLPEMISLVEDLFPKGNVHFVVDEAHATGIYGCSGRGLVDYYGVEKQVLVRLHTFGKALASSGAVLLITPVIKEYLINYARPLIYTTSISNASIIATNCSFDILEDGTALKLSDDLKKISDLCLTLLQKALSRYHPKLISLPSQLLNIGKDRHHYLNLVPHIIPVMTSQPRALSSYLATLGFNARPISWPTVPKGQDRIRVCLHANNTVHDVERLVEGFSQWAEEISRDQELKTEGVVQAKL